MKYWLLVWRQRNNRPSRAIIYLNALLIFTLLRLVIHLPMTTVLGDPWILAADMVSLLVLALLLYFPYQRTI